MSGALNAISLTDQVSAVGRILYDESSIADSKGVSQLADGEILTATVEQVQGGQVVLRTESGGVIRAASGGGFALSKGDIIEAVVDHSTGTLLLRVLDLNGPTGRNIPATSQQTITEMMSALSRNPEISAKAARFLAECGLPVNADNLQTLSQLTRGVNLGTLLGQVISLIGDKVEGTATLDALNPVEMAQQGLSTQYQTSSSNEAAPNAAEGMRVTQREAQQQPEEIPLFYNIPVLAEDDGLDDLLVLTVQTGAESMEAQQAEAPEQLQADAVQGIFAEAPEDAEAAGSANLVQENLIVETQKEGQAVSAPGVLAEQAAETPVPSAETKNADPMQAQQAVEPEQNEKIAEPKENSRKAESMPVSQAEDFAHPDGGGVTVRSEQEQAIQKLIEKLFVRPGEQTGEEIKKTVDETSDTLRALKFALDQSDIKNKELCLKTINQAIRQTELAEKSARFDYIQLPLTDNGDSNTAELYVFKRKKQKSGEEGEENTTILIALDTKNIGRVETLLAAAGNHISLEFRLEQTERTEDFKRGGAALEKALEAAGYSLTGIRFSGLEKRTTLLNAVETVGPVEKEAVRGVDIRI
jgi:hypothetical protein